MKHSVNKQDLYQLHKLFSQGRAVVDASRHLGILPSTVRRFYKQFEGGVVPTSSDAFKEINVKKPKPAAVNSVINEVLDHVDTRCDALQDQIDALKGVDVVAPPPTPTPAIPPAMGVTG